MKNTPCTQCQNRGQRLPEKDVEDRLSHFDAYWCKAYKEVVHDYFTECPKFISSVQNHNEADKK